MSNKTIPSTQISTHDVGNVAIEHKPMSPVAGSAGNMSLSHGVSRISIGNNSGTSSANYSSISSSLMNGNGELLVRRSPVSHLHHSNSQQHSSNISGTSVAGLVNSNGKNYYTLGSPSITTSYNSEDTSDLLNSSSLDDYGSNLNEALCSKIEQLQKQIESLTETQLAQEERFKRSKQENEDLLNRIHNLEDQLRELEINSEQRAQEDERRFKETMARQMKAKFQECEQHLNANYLLQQDVTTLQKDLMKSESQLRLVRSEKEKLEVELNEKNNEIASLDEEIHKLKLLVKHLKDEESVKSNLINILNEELVDNQKRSQQLEVTSTGQQNRDNEASLKSNNQRDLSSSSTRMTSVTTSGFDDSETQQPHNQSQKQIKLEDIDLLEESLSKLKDENRQLKERNEELQAQLLNIQLEEGRCLIQEGNKSYSLADELGEIDVHKLMEALKEQQDDNARLRKYIDNMLLKVVDTIPELLEKTIE